jgi:hypothetical protein
MLVDKITDETSARMIRVYAQSWARIEARMDGLTAQYEGLLADGKNTRNILAKMRALTVLQRDISRELLDYARWAHVEIRDAHNRLVPLSVEGATKVLESETGAAITFGRLAPAQVQSLAGILLSSNPIGEALAQRYGALAERIRESLLEAMIMGRHPSVVAGTLRDGYGMGLTSALRTSRTFLLMGSREAARAAYDASDMVTAYERHADFGPRTCMACALLDGTIIPAGQMLEDHWNGRCSMFPVTKTWRELGFDIDEPAAAQRQTGREWFEGQDETTQRQMMGKGLFGAWKEGQVRLEDIPHRVEDSLLGGAWVPRPLKDLTGRAA